ncbi:hypothetical protein BJ085DRAFT_538, partial [Dimargaris cristalligena]
PHTPIPDTLVTMSPAATPMGLPGPTPFEHPPVKPSFNSQSNTWGPATTLLISPSQPTTPSIFPTATPTTSPEVIKITSAPGT